VKRSVPIALAVVAMLASCASRETSRSADTASGIPAIRVTDAALLPTTVDALPNVDHTGYDALLGQLEGTPIVVNFWASWCEPCKAEMPMLAAAARRLADRVQFVGVDLLDARDAAQRFLAAYGVPYPNLFDPSGAIRTAVGSVGQPVTIFYAADGTIAAKIDGQLSEEQLRTNLDAISSSP
jgi:cytochrome c biogenesis protein CcmG/thiol:disulfide interchange protein DsbE